jgi:hypothetical protein
VNGESSAVLRFTLPHSLFAAERDDTRPEKIQAARVAVGKRIVVTFEDAA